MSTSRRIRVRLVLFVVVQALMVLAAIAVVSAATHGAAPSQSTAQTIAGGAVLRAVALQEASPAALDVAIVSSPWATLDHNNPSGAGEAVPQVFVVEAVITNTGETTATDVRVSLDYGEDPLNNWILLPGEAPLRTVEELTPNSAYHAYWFARYSSVIGASHEYTVTAIADNADLVETSDNYFGNPEPGKTVKTRATLSTGNSGVSQVSADIVVGVAFTVTIVYDLGTDPEEVILSPVGNPDFDPSAYRLLSSQVRFFNDEGTQQVTVPDRLYFYGDQVPSYADNAEATFTFIGLTASNTRLCSYTALGYGTTAKYDQFFCSDKNGTIVPITGTLSLSLTKAAIPTPIQQNQDLTYAIRYTNTGSLPLSYVWIWDDVDTTAGSIIASSQDPPGDPDESTSSRVAWYVDHIPAAGQPDSAGTLTLTLHIDGNGQDLADDTNVINNAFFGINQGSLPQEAALTSTITTTVQAPLIAFSKTDGLDAAEPGDLLTYTLRITNTGSVAAMDLMVTDTLPADVAYTSLSATPPEASSAGQTLIWDNLEPIPPEGGSLTIEIPVTVGPRVPNATILGNAALLEYWNPAGWRYEAQTAQDTTTVQGPVLTIRKSDNPDPVLTGRLLTYTLDYANDGPAAATGVRITDTIPLSTTYQACDGAPCTVDGDTVSWTLGEVPGSGTGSVSFSVLVSDTLETGTLIRNDDYGIIADQTEFIAGEAVTTRVNRNAAHFDGYAYVDADGDKTFDPDEMPLEGITITLPSATIPITYTNDEGYYRFRVEYEGPITISAGLPDGYFRTTPGVIVFADAILGVTETVSFGYAPVTSTFGVVYGTVFEDKNHDGVQDLGENGLPGAVVSSTLAAVSPATTDGLGWYTFRYDSPGTATITETNPLGYVSTTPDVVTTEVLTGTDNGSPHNFGDFAGIRIAGQVFYDEDVDGTKDPTEGGLADAVISANGASYTTTLTGLYSLYVTLSDENAVSISELDPDGYMSTNALPGDGMRRVDANTLSIDSPQAGLVYTRGDFGDVVASSVITISGRVWLDDGACDGCAANGQFDDGEIGLPGAVISLTSGLSQTTGADGIFTLYAPPNRVITVTEQNPDGYISTNAIAGDSATKVDNDTLRVGPMNGGSTSYNNLFGDAPLIGAAVITGTVFEDTDKNGVMDGGEFGLPGVTVTLEIENGSTIAVLTGPLGNYEFAVAPGIYLRLTSSGPGGDYYPTTPESVILYISSVGVYPRNDFGYADDSDVALITGLVFNDLNGNGEQDFGEPGLADAVIRLDDTQVFTTGGTGLLTGTFTFIVDQTGLHMLQETNPPDYRSTTPDNVHVNVDTLGESYYVEFGDTQNPVVASIYGTVFDDSNSSGEQDPGEPGLPGVVISVTVGGGTGVLTTTTKSYGQYSYGFEVDEAGLHTITEQDPAKPGYHSTTPDEITLEIVLGQSYHVSFGDTLNGDLSTITGIVYADQDGNGIQDPSELGLDGVTVSLSDGMSASTGSYGQYTFPIDAIGHVEVTETDPDGYHSTTPNTVTVYVEALGELYVVNFGDNNNPFSTSLFGTVFDDRNVNSVRDTLELGLSGVTVGLVDAPGSVPRPFITNGWGQYTFLIENAGTYTVTETDPSGYVSTIAIPGDATVTVVDQNTLRAEVSILGGDLGDNLFGDVQASQVISVTGNVWDDNGIGDGTAADGEKNGLEPYLTQAVVTLSSGMAQTTGPDGAFHLYAPTDQAIIVSETNPAGYVSTAAIAGENASRVDDDTLEIAGLPGGSTTTGHAFGDALPAELAVDKSGSADQVVAGTVFTYTLTYANDGPSYAQSVYITDTLDPDSTFGGVVSQPVSLSGPTVADQVLAWHAPTLEAGISGAVVYTVTIGADATEPLGNQVEITSNMPDTNPEDDSASVETVVSALADLEIAKTVDSDVVAAGAVLTYTVAYTNGGPSDAVSVRITDTLPGDVAFGGIASAQPSLAGFEHNGEHLAWYTPTLTARGSGSVVFTVTVNPDAIGSLINGVIITSSTPDADLTNNDASTTTSIGDPTRATIYGFIFDDTDGDGEWDVDEQPLPDVEVTLDDTHVATSGENGLYLFLISEPGTHTVVETDPEGYISTTPNEVHVDAILGSSYRADFGDAPGSSGFAGLLGTVFEDIDGDGEWDDDENGIEGVTVTLDGVSPATTDEYGSYSFSTTVEGVHTIVETDPEG